MTAACIVLPFPPTVNNLFASFVRKGKIIRVRSGSYETWRLRAGMALLKQRPLASFDTPVHVTMRCGRPDRRKRDLANLEKGVSDMLVQHRILSDDSIIHKLTMFWDLSVEGVQVEIEPYDAVRAAGRVA